MDIEKNLLAVFGAKCNAFASHRRFSVSQAVTLGNRPYASESSESTESAWTALHGLRQTFSIFWVEKRLDACTKEHAGVLSRRPIRTRHPRRAA
jgi:hypothetical protein